MKNCRNVAKTPVWVVHENLRTQDCETDVKKIKQKCPDSSHVRLIPNSVRALLAKDNGCSFFPCTLWSSFHSVAIGIR